MEGRMLRRRGYRAIRDFWVLGGEERFFETSLN